LVSIFYGRISPDEWTDGRTKERVFFRKEQRLEPFLPLVFCFALGYQEAPLIFCFMLGFLWFFALRLATKQNIGFVVEEARGKHDISRICFKKKKRVLGFKFLDFLGDGFRVKKKKKGRHEWIVFDRHKHPLVLYK
jgi:hypothetical protein